MKWGKECGGGETEQVIKPLRIPQVDAGGCDNYLISNCHLPCSSHGCQTAYQTQPHTLKPFPQKNLLTTFHSPICYLQRLMKSWTDHTLLWAKSHQLCHYNFSMCFLLQLHSCKTLLWASHLSSVACILNVLLSTNTCSPPSLPCKVAIRPAVILRVKFYTVITSLSTIIFSLLII